jgi:spore maturation protein CgeB
MKILAVVSAIDLSLKQAVPSWWQLFKGLYELEADLVVTPYVGKSVESLWWKSYKNPCEIESQIVNKIIRFRKNALAHDLSTKTKYNMGTKFKERATQFLTSALTLPRWRKHLTQTLEKEKNVEAVIFFNVPPNQIEGIPAFIRKEFGIPTTFYDMDAPDSLPGFSSGRLASNWYVGADLTEYDAFITNSEGAIPILEDMGAHNVSAIHFGIDPSIYHPIKANKDVDVFFYGQGAEFRQEWINRMITVPSRTLLKSTFLVGGGPFKIDLGKTKRINDIPISSWRKYCCRSKINLNITRKHHAEVYCSSTARIFELASLGCCIVSNPVNGLGKWFDLNEEVIVIKNEEEAVKKYEWLLLEDDVRVKMGEKARQRVLREHTHMHMAKKLIDILERTKTT